MFPLHIYVFNYLMATHMLLSFTFLMLLEPLNSEPTMASESDFGMFHLHSEHKDASIYFKEDLTMINKVHAVISIPNCQCIGYSDVEKINQLDYLGSKDYLFSFAIYVNDGKFGLNRSKCDLSVMDIQARTSLDFNLLGTPRELLVKRRQDMQDNYDAIQAILDEMFIDRDIAASEYDTYARRIEGAVLAKAILDFSRNSYVTSNKKTIFDTDKSGGVLFTQGTVFIRPCLLWPWYEAWILDSYADAQDGANNYKFKFTLPYDQATKSKNIPYYNEQDATLFNKIIDKMKKDGQIKDKHLANFLDNTGSSSLIKTFEFQSLFIPHRYTQEFLSLLAPFSVTYLSPYLYIPYVYQLMWDSNEWLHLRSDRNDTIYASRDNMLTTCSLPTIEDAMLNMNKTLAADMFYFAYGWCGGYPIDVRYVMERSKLFVMYHFYEVMFFLMLSLILCVICCVCNKTIAKGFNTACILFRSKIAGRYIRLKTDRDNDMYPLTNAEKSMASMNNGPDDDDDNDTINI